MKKRTKESKKRLNSLILLVAFSAILLIASTYAWFSTQRDVTISNLEGRVEVAEGLEISLDAQNWSQELDFSKLDLNTNAYSGNKNIEPTKLEPVSTIGSTGGSYLTMRRGTITGNKLTSIASVAEETALADSGFIAFDVFLKNSSRDGVTSDNIYLKKTSQVTVLAEDNKFSSRISKGVDTTGLQNTVRVAIASYQVKTAAPTDDQTAVLAAVNHADNKISQVAIWEPNSNFHVDYLTTNYGSVLAGKVDSTVTALLGTDEKIERTSKIPTYALDNTATTINDVYDWKTASTGLEKQIVKQTTITVPGSGMPGSYAMADETEVTGQELVKLVQATGDGTTQFSLPGNKITKARIYVWLEGQDVDCINYASHGGGIEVIMGIEKLASGS